MLALDPMRSVMLVFGKHSTNASLHDVRPSLQIPKAVSGTMTPLILIHSTYSVELSKSPRKAAVRCHVHPGPKSRPLKVTSQPQLAVLHSHVLLVPMICGRVPLASKLPGRQKWPGAHCATHSCSRPVLLLHVPAAHGTHASAPSTLLHLPISHGAQASIPAVEQPAVL